MDNAILTSVLVISKTPQYLELLRINLELYTVFSVVTSKMKFIGARQLLIQEIIVTHLVIHILSNTTSDITPLQGIIFLHFCVIEKKIY